MPDYKTKLIEDLYESLSIHFNPDDISIVSQAITKILANYEVTEKSTQLTLRDDKNERLLKRYAACLMVDGKSEKTIAIYIRQLQRFSDSIGKPFDEISTYEIRYYLASLKDTGVSFRTLENYRSYISAFFQWLTREDFIIKNPCDKIAPIKYTIEVRHPFTDTEIDSLRSSCITERNRALVELLLSSGLRVTELISLNIDDIDFNRLSVHVRSGKGQKERITYMTDVCAMHLKKYLFTRTDQKPALFLSATKKNRITSGGVRNVLKTIGANAKVTDVHPHRFRRTFATNLAKRGMNVQTIAKLMGHSDIQTTMVYVSLDESKIISEYKQHTA